MIEHFFQCPYCWERISVLLDSSLSSSYIEDCEVCCNPIEITVHFTENKLIEFSGRNIEQ
ncbi:MAG: CPXCG motif-containing cysteine-rich protein [Bacteroidota bacterium]